MINKGRRRCRMDDETMRIGGVSRSERSPIVKAATFLAGSLPMIEVVIGGTVGDARCEMGG